MPSQAYNQPLFDLLSYARRGPGRRDHLSPGEIRHVARTVRRTPEVMVKVLPGSPRTPSRPFVSISPTSDEKESWISKPTVRRYAPSRASW